MAKVEGWVSANWERLESESPSVRELYNEYLAVEASRSARKSAFWLILALFSFMLICNGSMWAWFGLIFGLGNWAYFRSEAKLRNHLLDLHSNTSVDIKT